MTWPTDARAAPSVPEFVDRHRRVVFGWLVVSVGLIVASTLFPFDFRLVGDRSLWGAFGRIDLDLRSSYVYRDMPANIGLFVPFGFSLAAALRQSRFTVTDHAAVAIVTGAGMLLSYLLESVQGVLLLRFASFGDVISNTIGSAVGAGLGVWLAASVLERFTLADGARPRWVLRLAVAAVWTCAVVVTTVALDHAAAPAGWASEFPLVVGNETSGDRPWTGTMAAFSIARSGGGTEDPFAAWSFVGEATGVPPLRRIGASDDVSPTPDGTTLDGEHWWRSVDPVDGVSEAIVTSRSFEVVLDVETTSGDQFGPARILTISDGVLTRNLTVGQSGTDLALRVRSALLGSDGSDPEIIVPDVFHAGEAQRIVVRYAGEVVEVVVDGASSSAWRLDLGGEVAVALWSFPHAIVRIRTGALGEDLIRMTFRAVALAPWGIVLAGLMSFWTRRRMVYSAVAALGIGVGFELVMVAAIGDRSFDLIWALLGTLSVGAVTALFRCPPAREPAMRGATRR